jgi:hypothetical protein
MLRSSFLAVTIFAGTCLAQTPEAAKFYKLDFVVKEVDGGKVLNARAYSTNISTEKSSPGSSIRAGSKVPYPTSTAPGSTQFNYAEVGVNIDCRSATEVGNELSVIINAEVSSTAQESSMSVPIIRQNKWSSIVVVPIRKAVVVFSSDDATSKHQMQLELTAVPIK